MNLKEYHLAKTEEQQTQILDYLSQEPGFLSVDTETSSVDAFTCSIMGVSLSKSPNEAFYLPINDYQNGELKLLNPVRLAKLISGLNALLTNPASKLIMHNSAFDIWVLRNTLDIDCMPQLHTDTLLLKHTVDESKPHGLKNIAVKYFGEDAKDEQTDLKDNVIAKGGRWNADNKDMFMADMDILGKYACADADLTLKVFEKLSGLLEQQGLVDFFYKEEVMPLNEVIIEDMIGVGVKCDIEYLNQLKTELANDAVRLEHEAHADFKKEYTDIYENFEYKLLEEEFPLTPRGNLFQTMYLNSGLTIYNGKDGNPSFLKKVIEEAAKDHPDSNLLKWKLGQIEDKEFIFAEYDLIHKSRKELYLAKAKKKSDYVINLGSTKQLQEILFNKLGETAVYTKKGNATVDVEILEQFAKQYTFLAKIMEWRKVTKLLETYVEGILYKQKDSILRSSWLAFGTDSGRLASRDPNLMNLPREDKRIKHSIIARPGKVLIGTDYAQIEPRVFASLSNEQSLINSFIQGVDFYGTVAVEVGNLKEDPNTLKITNPKARQDAKEIALGIPYGMKKWKLAHILGCTIEEAQEKIDTYWAAFPDLHKFMLMCHGEVLTNGFVRAETGRLRRFTGINLIKNSKSWDDKKILNKLLNLGINFKIQATASGIINRAAIKLYKEFKARKWDARILLQVHDELVVEAAEEIKDEVSQLIKFTMENIHQLKVPLIAEPVIGTRLSECK